MDGNQRDQLHAAIHKSYNIELFDGDILTFRLMWLFRKANEQRKLNSLLNKTKNDMKKEKIMKKRTLSFALLLVMLVALSGNAFASTGLEALDLGNFRNRQQAFSEALAVDAEVTDETNTRMFGPAPPVTEVRIIWAGIVNGRVEIDVRIMGYGNRTTSVTGGLAQPKLINTHYIGHTPVVGFIETYDLGPAIIGGPYQFDISARSFNSPWNTMSDWFRFNIS